MLIVGALNAVVAPDVAAQYQPRGRSRFRVSSPHFFAGLDAGSGGLRYLCAGCEGTNPGSRLVVSGRFGLRFFDGRLLTGVEVRSTIGAERFTMLGVTATGAALNRRLMVGAGLGLSGYRFRTLILTVQPGTTGVPQFQDGGFLAKWGYGAELHAGLRLPIGRALALTPTVSYATSLGGIVEYGVPLTGSLLTTGSADFSVLSFGIGVLWSQR